MFASKFRIDETECQKARFATPSPLNGERGGNVIGIHSMRQINDALTPHPQSLSPLRGEGSPRRALLEIFNRAFAIAPTRD